MVSHQPKECQKTQRLLNDFIAEELPSEASQEVSQHLESCPLCQQEMKLRQDLRLAIRQSWAKQPMPEGLADRIGRSAQPRSAWPSGVLLRLAAGLVLALAAFYLLTLFVPDSLPLLAVDHYHEAVQDHLRCPERLHPMMPSLPDEERFQGLHGLETVLRTALQEASLVSAHLCRFADIDFIHFVFKGPERTFSLVLEERGPRQRLADVEPSQQRNVGDISVRLMEREGTSVASYESKGYFVYLVLDEEDPQLSYSIAQALFPTVQDSLQTR